MSSRGILRSQHGIRLVIAILVLFHIIGVGIMLYSKDGVELSYMNLLLCGLLLFLSESNYFKALIPLLVIFVGGFVVEYIGVHTGLLFGNYRYGGSLGPKFEQIPLIIGINWYCIVLASAALVHSLKWHLIIKSIFVGALSTGLDFIIEPVAVKLDFWQWDGGIIPLWNYICWFGFASIFAFIYFKFSSTKNKPAQSLFLIWLVFFTILTFAL